MVEAGICKGAEEAMGSGERATMLLCRLFLAILILADQRVSRLNYCNGNVGIVVL